MPAIEEQEVFRRQVEVCNANIAKYEGECRAAQAKYKAEVIMRDSLLTRLGSLSAAGAKAATPMSTLGASDSYKAAAGLSESIRVVLRDMGKAVRPPAVVTELKKRNFRYTATTPLVTRVGNEMRRMSWAGMLLKRGTKYELVKPLPGRFSATRARKGVCFPSNSQEPGVVVDREGLRHLIQDRCLLFGDYMLSTGEPSKFYFDCKRATLDGATLTHIADAYLERIWHSAERPEAIGGLTMGADFISAAVAMRAFQSGITLNACIARKERKPHGTRNFIENQLPRATKILVVDDVITSGNSTATACRHFLDAGYKIVEILALVDREEKNGRQNLEKEFKCPVSGLFRTSDFPKLVTKPDMLTLRQDAAGRYTEEREHVI